ncbi:hypothetical protein V5H41_28390, partial [Salmonella enterica]
PLAILLDGQFWAENMPVWPALASLTHQRLLPGAVYLLIDAIDTQHRSQELPPLAILLDGQFWAENMPVWPALASLTHQRLLPGA